MAQLLQLLSGFLSESWPPAPKFTEKDVPNLASKVFLVTGGNAGIGRQLAKVLLEHNAKVYLACRSGEKATKAARELKEGNPAANVHILSLDLSNLASVKACAAEFMSKESTLDVLYNSAGVMVPPLEQLTIHGHDLQFGTNVLGHFYLTQRLLPTLIHTSKQHGHARVVNTSGLGHLMTPGVLGGKGPIDYDTLRDGEKRKQLGTKTLYLQSKSANLIFARELARRYGDQGIVSIALNPGTIKTELQRNLVGLEHRMIHWMTYDVSLGALTQLYAGTAPDAASLNGEYLIPWARVGSCRNDHKDEQKQIELWEWLEAQVKEFAP